MMSNDQSLDELKALVDEVKANREKLKLGGGEKRIKAQHEKGKMMVRERIDKLLDEGTFVEMDAYMLHRHTDFDLDKDRYLGDGMVAGFGKINGRTVCIYAQDFTILGGSFSEVAGQKAVKMMELAMEAGVPVIALNDGGGARIQEGIYSLKAYGDLFYKNAHASGVIPQICLILGPCAGGGVYSPALTDFVIMARGVGNMFITGPQVIKAVTGEEVDMETLGGADAHAAVSGVAHFATADEDAALQLTRALIGYLPLNNREPAPYVTPNDDPWRQDAELNTIVPTDPNLPYDMKDVINKVVDLGSFLEVHASFAQNAVVGLARLHGQVVGISANQPSFLGGAIDINASDKIARFVRFCDAFNIPIISFTDTPGFLPGVNQEHGGVIRHGAKIIFAYAEATVPKLTVVTRKGYGGAYIVMGSKHLHADMLFAWPMAEIAVMGAGGAVNILFRKELASMTDAEAAKAERARLVGEYRQKFANPYRAAAAGHADDVILPSETRPRLIAALEMLRDKKVSLPTKKHGNIPL